MTFKLSACLLVSAFLLFFIEPASAHSGQPRLELSAGNLSPDSTLEIRGAGFEFEEQVTLALAGPPADLPLGSIHADTEGGFQLVINLPPDLAAGTYLIRASTDDHVLSSARFSVQGAAAQEDAGEGPREEEDGLLAAMPTLPPGFTSTPIAEAARRVAGAPSDTKDRSLIPGVAVGAVFLVLFGIGLRRWRS